MAGDRTIKIKFDGSAEGFVRAANRTKRALKDVDDTGLSTGKKLLKSVSSGLSNLGTQLGPKLGAGLVSGIASNGPIVGAAVAALLVTAVVAAAPAVAAGIVGGVGLGGIVGGVMLAAKDKRVNAALSSLGRDAEQMFGEAAFGFTVQMRGAIQDARHQLSSLMPDVRRLFDTIAPALRPLINSVGQGLRTAVAGIADAAPAMLPIFRAIGQGIAGAGQAIAYLFRQLKDNGPAMAMALKFVFDILNGAIVNVANALNFLVETFEFVIKLVPGGKQALDSWKSASDGAKTGTNGLAEGFQKMATEAGGASSAMVDLRQKAQDLANANVSYAQSQINSRKATQDAAAALRDNSKAKLTNKQRADANMTALLNMATAFNSETAAGEKSGIGARQAAGAYATNRAALIKMAEKAGLGKQKAIELADKLLAIPKNVSTDVKVNTGPAEAKLVTFQRKINGLHGKTVTVTVQQRQAGDHVSGPGGSGTLLRRWGGIDYAMARGGAIGAHFTRSPRVLYGERETGGEAFIPRRGDLRRSRAIAGRVVRDWLDGDVVWRSGSGVPATGSGSSGGGGGDVSVSVNLDGQPFYSATATAVRSSQRREAWRNRVGRR